MINVNVLNGNMTQEEINEYIKLIYSQNPGRDLEYLELSIDSEFVDMKYEFKPLPFKRIRRITGYLAGDITNWNDAKKAEERDRIKHSVC